MTLVVTAVAIAFVVANAGSIAVETFWTLLTDTAFNVPTILPASVVNTTGVPPIVNEIVNVVELIISRT